METKEKTKSTKHGNGRTERKASEGDSPINPAGSDSRDINLERITMFTDPSHKVCSIVDAKRNIADAIYNMCHGLPALSLSIKIYNSNGVTSYNAEERKIIREVAQFFTPSMIEAIYSTLDAAEAEDDNK